MYIAMISLYSQLGIFWKESHTSQRHVCGWLYSWYCDLQHVDQSVQEESHDSRSVSTSPKNAQYWLHTRCNVFWFLDLGYGCSHMWEPAVAIFLLDIEKAWCNRMIDVHQQAGKHKQAELCIPSEICWFWAIPSHPAHAGGLFWKWRWARTAETMFERLRDSNNYPNILHFTSWRKFI
jgi:hypothetical protein